MLALQRLPSLVQVVVMGAANIFLALIERRSSSSVTADVVLTMIRVRRRHKRLHSNLRRPQGSTILEALCGVVEQRK